MIRKVNTKVGIRFLVVALIASLILSGIIAGCAQAPAPPVGEEAAEMTKAKPAPTVVIIPAAVEQNTKTQMVIMGSGFELGQKLTLLARQTENAYSYVVDSDVTPDETGAFIVDWTFGKYSSMLGKLAPNGGEGVYSLQVTDADFNVLASTPFAIAVIKDKPEEEWAPWAKVLLK